MRLLIISQDGLNACYFNSVCMVENESNKKYEIKEREFNVTLGEFKEKTRANEVFNEIIKKQFKLDYIFAKDNRIIIEPVDLFYKITN